MAPTNVSASSIDIDPVNYGGVRNTVTWTDSSSVGSLTYTVKRNTVNSLNDAVPVGSNIPSGQQTYTDMTAVQGTRYYYFIEVTDGTDTVASDADDVLTVNDSKIAVNNNYLTQDPNAFVYDPGTDSFM